MSNSILILKIKHIEIPNQTNYNLLIFSQINFIRIETKQKIFNQIENQRF